MDYKKLSEESLDGIMEKLREAGRAEQPESAEQQKEYFSPDVNEDIIAAFRNLDIYIPEMAAGRHIGLLPAPMSKKKGLMRIFARLIEKVYFRIAELSNRDIRIFNAASYVAFLSVRDIVNDLIKKVGSQEEEIKALKNEMENINRSRDA